MMVFDVCISNTIINYNCILCNIIIVKDFSEIV